MNKLVYLPELDSVRNTKEEIIIGQKALYEEIVVNGNRVVLSFNQIADSEAFLSAFKSEEQYKYIVELFKLGYIKLSNYQYKGKDGMVEVNTASQYIQNALQKNISKEEGKDKFIFSGLPIKEDEKELSEIMLKALKYSRPSLLSDNYTPREDDEKRLEYLVKYTDILLTLSREELANNPIKKEEVKDFLHYIHLICNMNIRELCSNNQAEVWKYFSKACNILDEIERKIKEHNEIKKCNDKEKIDINGRSNWLNYLGKYCMAHESEEKSSRTERKIDDAICLAEAIVHMAYNYTIEDSIANVSKHYKDGDDKDFYRDFINRMEKYWKEHLEHLHVLYCERPKADTNNSTEKSFFQEKEIEKEIPCWETAVRVTTEKRIIGNEKKDEKERKADNTIENKIPVYEHKYEEEKKKWKKKVRNIISKQIFIAFCYIILFCVMDYISGEFEQIVALGFELMGFKFNAAATVVVNIVLYTIVLGAFTSLITSVMNLPDILESLKDMWKSLRDIKIVKNAHRGVAYVYDRKEGVINSEQ